MAYRENAFGDPIWTQLGSDIDGDAAYDNLGSSVSVSSDGTIVAIGAPYNDSVNGNSSNTGHVRVFQYTNSAWSQLGSDIDGGAANDYSGFSVSLSSDGTIVAIGASGNNSNTGHVQVYQYSNNSWSQLGNDITGEASDDYSGYSVSLDASGTIVAVGAYGNDDNGNNSGHVRVYQYSGSSWTQLGQDIDGEAAGDGQGNLGGDIAVSLSSDGTIVAIGASGNDDNGSVSGHVRVYQYNGTTWNKLGEDIDGEASQDHSGYSVSLSSDGTIVAIGAPLNDGNGNESGHVRVYQYSNSSWSQLGSDIDGEDYNNRSGWSVSLDATGTIVAIGAYGNNGFTGHVRVFQYDSSANLWTQLGSDIDGENGSDFSGWSVSLSSDGTIVAIGAPRNDTNGSNSGQVRVYDYAPVMNYNICFPGNTPVATDQGIVPIKKINTNFHTIRNMSIQDITKSVLYDKYVVCFKTNSLGENIPSQDTYISKNHMVFFKGEFKPAYQFVNYDNIIKTKYNGELMYNVLLDNHNKMLVNNLICETLDPDNTMAKLNNLLKQLPREKQKIVIKEFNEHIKNNHIDNKKSKADFVINV